MRGTPLQVFLLLIALPVVLGQDSSIPEDLRLGFSPAGLNGDGSSLLLRMQDVHLELQIGPSQEEQLRGLLIKISRDRRFFFQNLLDGMVCEEPLPANGLRQLLDLYNEQSDQLLMQSLSRAQQLRLNQLKLQLWGVNAMQHEDIALALALSKHQKLAYSQVS